MKCPQCPVAGDCLGATHARYSFLCGWAATGNPVQRAHVVARSRIAEGQPLPDAAPESPPPALALAVLRRAARCWFRINPRSCCDGVTCHLRGTWVDPARDCRDCAELPP